MDTTKPRKYNYFIGVDISKNTLDISFGKVKGRKSHRIIANTLDEINSFISELRTHEQYRTDRAVFGMEQTGIYGNHLLKCLRKIRANIVVENALKIKNSLGMIRGKTDKTDAKRVLEYLIKNRENLNLYQERRDIIKRLSSLSRLRARLIIIHGSMATPLKEDSGFVDSLISQQNIRLCESSLQAIKSDIANIDKLIMQIWKADEHLNNLMTIVQSVKCIGPTTALEMIIVSNEFRNITTARSFASYAGIAPFQHSSGTSVKRRTKVSSIANKKMKSLLHICAMGATGKVPDIKEYWIRKTIGENKSKMSTINAIRFKLICRVFACVNQSRLYSEEYIYKPKIEYKLLKESIVNPYVMRMIFHI